MRFTVAPKRRPPEDHRYRTVQELYRRLRGAALEGAKLVEAVARATSPVGDTQQLRERHGVRETTRRNLPAAEVVNTTPYAVVVHEGRRPGGRAPAPGMLTLWMRFKGIVETSPPKEVGRYGGVEKRIAMSLARKGTKGQPWLRKAGESRAAQVKGIYQRWLREGR